MSDLMEVRRKGFEAWAEAEGHEVVRFHHLTGYRGVEVYAAWEAWNAALDSVVVELPVKISSCNVSANGFVNPNAEHYDEAIDDCAEAIHAAGIKTKVKV